MERGREREDREKEGERWRERESERGGGGQWREGRRGRVHNTSVYIFLSCQLGD